MLQWFLVGAFGRMEFRSSEIKKNRPLMGIG